MAGYYPTIVAPTYNTPWYNGYDPMGAYKQPTVIPVSASPNNYMINVEGEVGAKAWQMPSNLAPNTIIPLWDVDGKHIYFKSVDQYGRLNPMKKGVVVFEEEPVSEPPTVPQIDMSLYATKDDLVSVKNELLAEIKQINKTNQVSNKTNQNGSK